MNRMASELYDEIHDLLMAGDFDGLLEICKIALKNAREKGDIETKAVALIGWAQAHRYLGKFREARILADGAEQFARNIGAMDILVYALNTIAAIKLSGQFQHIEAEDDFREALQIAHDCGDSVGVATALAGIGAARNADNDYTRGKRYAVEAFETARDINAPYLQVIALSVSGDAFANSDDHERALQAFQDALEIAQENNLRLSESMIVGNIGAVLSVNERYREDGIRMLEKALAMAQDIRCAPHEYTILHSLGIAFQLQSYMDAAQDFYETMIMRAQTWGARAYEGAGFFTLGMLFFSMSDFDEALATFNQAQVIARETLNPNREAMVESWLGATYANQNDFDEALKHYTTARTIYDSLDDERRTRQMTQIIVWTYIQRIVDGLLRFIGIRNKDKDAPPTNDSDDI